jgi:tRNA threonylcarbamoyladenosine biosynthesis protein TsaE
LSISNQNNSDLDTKIYGIDQLDDIASWVVDKAGEERIWVFKGEMGAGKTTLVKSIAKQLNVVDPISSPTFGLVNHYARNTGEEIYHFDFYRIEDPDEVLDIGIEEYFYSGNFCWIEWPEKIAPYLPEEFFLIEIAYLDTQTRKITLEHFHNA